MMNGAMSLKTMHGDHLMMVGEEAVQQNENVHFEKQLKITEKKYYTGLSNDSINVIPT
jgi:hypothetical protein